MTLDDDYQLVKEPGPDVLRLRVAITEAEGSWRVIDGRLGDELDDDLQAVATKEPSEETRSFVGKAGVEAELLDSTAGTRLAAAIDRRVGARTLKPEKSAWSDVERAFRYWADRLRERLGAAAAVLSGASTRRLAVEHAVRDRLADVRRADALGVRR